MCWVLKAEWGKHDARKRVDQHCEMWVSHSSVAEDLSLLGFDSITGQSEESSFTTDPLHCLVSFNEHTC